MTGEDLASLRALVASTRELMLAVGTTDLPASELDELRDQVDVLTDKIGAVRRPHVVRASFEELGRAKAAGEVWRAFANNPFATPLNLIYEEDTARATFVAHALHEGPAGCLHGGIAAHLMDCVLGSMMQANGRRCRTGTLEVRYLRPTPLAVPLELFGEITSSNGRRHLTRGTISHGGEVTVEAKGFFVEVAADPNEGG